LLAVNVEVPLQLSTTVTVGVLVLFLVMQFLNLQHLYIHPIFALLYKYLQPIRCVDYHDACIITPCDCAPSAIPVTVNVDVPLQLSTGVTVGAAGVSLIVNIAGERLVLTHAFEPAHLLLPRNRYSTHGIK